MAGLDTKADQIATSSQTSTSTALTVKQYPGSRRGRLSTVERPRTASEEAANGLREIEEWMEQEMRSRGFIPAPLGLEETAEVAAALSG
jgi:hypothetical protein